MREYAGGTNVRQLGTFIGASRARCLRANAAEATCLRATTAILPNCGSIAQARAPTPRPHRVSEPTTATECRTPTRCGRGARSHALGAQCSSDDGGGPQKLTERFRRAARAVQPSACAKNSAKSRTNAVGMPVGCHSSRSLRISSQRTQWGRSVSARPRKYCQTAAVLPRLALRHFAPTTSPRRPHTVRAQVTSSPPPASTQSRISERRSPATP